MSVDPEQQPENPLEPDQPPEPDADPDAPSPLEPEAEPIEGDDQDQEPAPEAPPAEPSSYALSVEQEKKLTAEVKRHTGRVSEIIGDAATDLLTCPLCNPDLQGFLYEGDLLNPQTPVQVAVRDALAPAPSVQYKQDPATQTCQVCDGEGSTLTGSHHPQYKTRTCTNCNGFGYYPPPGVGTNGAFGPHEERELVAVLAGETNTDDVDGFGHPRLLDDGRENPNFGRMPQYIDPNFP